MTININLGLEVELDGIRGPLTFFEEEDGPTVTIYDIDTFSTATGSYIGAGLYITSTSIKVISVHGVPAVKALSIESLLAQQILETLLKDSGDAVNIDFSGLWSVGYVRTTRGESDLIKDIINEKIESLREAL